VNGLDNYKEILELKKINVVLDANDDALVEMNEVLAEIIDLKPSKYAVRFNIDGGFINCHIDKTFLILTNAGLASIINTEDLFKKIS